MDLIELATKCSLAVVFNMSPYYRCISRLLMCLDIYCIVRFSSLYD